MKYIKKSKKAFPNALVLLFIIFFVCVGFFQKDIISRSILTINLGSIYVDYLNEKAEIINYIENNNIETLSLSMSPNNYVRLQKERSSMVNNFVLTGKQWSGVNNYFKTSVLDRNNNSIKAEIKLFGLNPDHFRDVNGHSFRIKFDGGKGYGNKKVNFLNPRSRDFITDPLLNIVYSKLYNGIGIQYFPYRIILNKADYGILYREDFFDKYLIEENQKRESVIFELVNDSIKFNYKGEDDSLESLAFEIEQLFKYNYSEFLKRIDINKVKGVMKLGLLINDEHPFSDINMHWYYNPVTDLIEPTIREGFLKSIEEINLDAIASNNKIINDIYNEEIKLEILSELKSEINLIEDIIIKDPKYIELKEAMVGFKDIIEKKEETLISNINYIKKLTSRENRKNEEEVEYIYFTNNITLYKDLTIKENQKLVILPGVDLNLNNSYLKVLGGFEAVGEKNSKIKIFGSGKSGSIFFNSNKKIKIDNVLFFNLTNEVSKFNQPSSITFYECELVDISNSEFSNNLRGDDFLNFFRSKGVYISNSSFHNILNDAIDSDFSKLIIENSKFYDIGNDAVDGSGSYVKIINSSFKDVKDKAISAGENSTFEINNNFFQNNEIALVSKDASKLYVDNAILSNNELDFTSFIKKKFFGPSESYFSNTNISNYLIENLSIIKGIDSINYSTNVETKLYGNIYGRASN